MRSLVADIFHSLARNSVLASSGNSSSCGPITTRIGAASGAGSSIRYSAAPGAGVHRKTAEHWLARNAALDGEIAERAAAGKAERQRLAIGKRHRGVERDAASRDVAVAHGSRQRDADGSLACGKGGTERPDFHGRRQRLVANESIRRRHRKAVHRPAGCEAVALRARAAAVLNGTRWSDRGNDEL